MKNQKCFSKIDQNPKKKNNEHEEYIDEHSNQIQQYELESKPEFMK